MFNSFSTDVSSAEAQDNKIWLRKRHETIHNPPTVKASEELDVVIVITAVTWTCVNKISFHLKINKESCATCRLSEFLSVLTVCVRPVPYCAFVGCCSVA